MCERQRLGLAAGVAACLSMLVGAAGAESTPTTALENTGSEPSTGLPAAEERSLWEAFDQARRSVRPLTPALQEAPGNEGATHLVSNPGQRLRLRFLPDRVRLLSGRPERDWSGEMSLVGVAGEAAIHIEGSRFEFIRPGLVEFFDNRREGIKHGFLIGRRPDGVEAALVLGLRLEGLQARTAEGGLHFVSSEGDPVIAYTGLQVWDSTGAELTASMRPTEDGFAIEVADVGARYPITIDPLITSLEAKLAPQVGTGTGFNNSFGQGVAISGERALIGAPGDDREGEWSGGAYVFTRENGFWIEEARLSAEDETPGDQFGRAVAIDGDTAVVGAHLNDEAASNSGAAYVFDLSGEEPVQQQKLMVTEDPAGVQFGYSVAIDGNTVLVGARYDDTVANRAGAAFVFTRSGSTWSLQERLTAGDGAKNDYLGSAVAIEGDVALVGAFHHNGARGAAYLFTRSGKVWSEHQKLTASDAEVDDLFGWSVALSGKYAFVGCPHDHQDAPGSGSVYVFHRVGATWGEYTQLHAPDGPQGAEFGTAVAASAGTIAHPGTSVVVGAFRTHDDTGAAYVFSQDGIFWPLQATFTAEPQEYGDQFGYSVAIEGDTALAGAPGDDPAGGSSGSAHIFKRDGGGWALQRRIDAPTRGGQIWSVSDVSISGDTALVGCFGDFDHGIHSGAAYIFVRSYSSWIMQQRLTPPSAERSDHFGDVVSLDGDTAAIAADGDDDFGESSGAVYVYVRSAGVWSLQQKLTADDASAYQRLGSALSIEGDTLLVGAEDDDEISQNSGTAYVFVRSGGSWSQEEKLFPDPLDPPDPFSAIRFGASVALSGDTALIGASLDGADNVGSAYVFTRSGTDWTKQAKLAAGDPTAGSRFGTSVSLDGDNALVGASEANSAYVFVRSGGSWSEQEALSRSDRSFGRAVVIKGDRAAVGASGATVDGFPAAGKVYTFDRSGTTWSVRSVLTSRTPSRYRAFGGALACDLDRIIIGALSPEVSATVFRFSEVFGYIREAHLSAGHTAESDLLGTAVSLSGDRCLIGATGDDDAGISSGAAYVFKRVGGNWSMQARFMATDPAGYDYFGGSVGLSGDTAVVGAGPFWVQSPDYGRAFVFTDDGHGWSVPTELRGDRAGGDDRFGHAVAVSGDTVVVGDFADDAAAAGAGCAYVFVRSGDAWPQQAKLTASDATSGDRFGSDVSISGSTALIGAEGDDEAGVRDGSAYVFARKGTNWAQQTKLTAGVDGPGTGAFGYAVSVSGDAAIVGTWMNDGRQGSAFVFEGSGSAWSRVAKLEHPGADGESFGRAVSISGDKALVGSSNSSNRFTEDGSAYLFIRTDLGWLRQGMLTAHDGSAYDSFGDAVAISGSFAVVSAQNVSAVDAYERDTPGQGAAYAFRLDLIGGDRDGDGGSDDWETIHGFNPDDGTDLARRDRDGDGDLDLLELFQGTDLADPSSRYGVMPLPPAMPAGSSKIRYRRATGAPIVRAYPRWSVDLRRWYAGGRSEAGEVVFSEVVVASGPGYEIVELTAEVRIGDFDGLFVRLELFPVD